MKRTLALLLSISLLLCFTACEKKPPVESEVSSVISSEESVSEPSPVESAETSSVEPSTESSLPSAHSSASSETSSLAGQNTVAGFNSFIGDLKADRIGRVAVSISNGLEDQKATLTDSTVIRNLVDVLGTVRAVSAEPYEQLYGGGGTTFSFYDQNGEQMGGFHLLDSLAYYGDRSVQLQVTGVDSDRLDALYQDMDFTTSTVYVVPF